jgi:polar amino acid transport system permease protein
MLETMRAIFTPDNLLLLLKGAGTTLLLSVVGVAVGVVLGVIGGVIKTYPSKICLVLRPVVWLYVEIFRRTPLLILILLSYFWLAMAGIEASNMAVAIIAVSIYSVAYMVENIRAGIESLPHAQWDAGLALGMTGRQLLRSIILPQALKLSIPPSVGFMQSLVKDTSMATIIGVVELTHAGVILRYKFPLGSFYIFGSVMVAYFLICYPLSWLGTYMERRLKRDDIH